MQKDHIASTMLTATDLDPVERVEHVDMVTPPPKDNLLGRLVGSKIARFLAIGSLMLTYNASLAGAFLTGSVITAINAELGPNPAYPWLGTATTVAAGASCVLLGTLSDLLGRRWFMIITCSFGILAGIVGVTARNVPTVIAANALLGYSQGASTISISALAELVQVKNRGYVQGGNNLACVPWTLTGSLIAHKLLSDTAAGWRGVYYVVLAMQTSATLSLTLFYHPSTALAMKTQEGRDILANFDYIGLVGLLAGTILTLLGITWLPSTNASSAKFIAPFVVGLVVLTATGFYEAYGAKNPLLHPFLFRRVRTFTMIVIAAAVAGMLLLSLVSLFPAYVSAVWDGNDALKIGIDGLPMGAGAVVSGWAGAALIPLLGPRFGTTAVLAMGALLQLVFIPALAATSYSSKGMALAFSTLGAAGISSLEVSCQVLITLATPPEWLGFAQGIVGLSRSIGGACGYAIYFTIYQSKIAEYLPADVGAAAVKAGLPETSVPALLGVLTGAVKGNASDIVGVTPAILGDSMIAMRLANLAAFKLVWLTAIPFAALTFIVTLFVKDLSHTLTSDIVQHVRAEDKNADSSDGSELNANETEKVEA